MGLLAKLFGATAEKVLPVHVDDGNYKQEVTHSPLPVVLDVWGPDCGPCRQLEPIIIRLATRYQGRVKVAEVNAAAAPRIMQRLRVMGTPTVVYFRDGHEVERTVGFRGELYHTEIIEAELLAPDGGQSSKRPSASG